MSRMNTKVAATRWNKILTFEGMLDILTINDPRLKPRLFINKLFNLGDIT